MPKGRVALFHRESCRWICTSRGGGRCGDVCTIRAVWDPVDRIGELPCISGVRARTSEKCQCAWACSRSFHAGMGGMLSFPISPTRSGCPLTRARTREAIDNRPTRFLCPSLVSFYANRAHKIQSSDLHCSTSSTASLHSPALLSKQLALCYIYSTWTAWRLFSTQARVLAQFIPRFGPSISHDKSRHR